MAEQPREFVIEDVDTGRAFMTVVWSRNSRGRVTDKTLWTLDMDLHEPPSWSFASTTVRLSD